MKKMCLIASLAGLLVAAATPAYSQAEEPLAKGETVAIDAPVSLNAQIVVDGPYVRLNDFFTNVPVDIAETAVAYAPKPGRKAAFDANWLYRIANAYGLKWRPLSADLRALVSRDSIIVQHNEIQSAVEAALSKYDLPMNSEVELSNRSLTLHVPSNIMAEITVEDITYNARSNRFGAVISVGEKGMAPVERLRVTGTVHKMIEIPTLNRRISKGEVISPTDLSWVRQKAERTQRDVIVDLDQIVGMAPKRSLRADVPIRTRDIQEPVLAPKGEIVTIILKKPGMTLTSRGKAMEDGSDGEAIRVVNTNTNRTIEAIVVGPNIVTVLPMGHAPQLASNQ